MSFSVRLFTCAAALFLAASGLPAAFAAAANRPAPAYAPPREPMKALKITTQPIGHYDFCKRYPQKCAANKGSSAPLRLSAKQWQLISRVNARINRKVTAATDAEIYGKEEYWEYPDKSGWFGDCEDYVLLKQRILEEHGIPAADLLITVVRKPDGEAHAVLTVRTERGDYVLDNLRDAVLDWQDTEYNYIKRQSVYHAGLWAAIAPRGNKPFAVAADILRESGGLASTQAIAARPN